MALNRLYVRTGNNGSDPAVSIRDLGYIIPTGASWTLLSSSNPDDALSGGGNFSSRDLRDSQNLYDLLRAGTLEWSKDGSTEELGADYRADYMLLEDFTDDNASFNDITVSGDFNGIPVSSLVDHLDGGASKHDASEIDVEGTYTSVSPSSPTDLETFLSELDTTVSGINAGNNAWTTINGDSGTATATAQAETINITGLNGILTTATDGSPDTLVLDADALLPRDGSRPMTGNLDLASNNIENVFNITVSGLTDIGDGRLVIPQAIDINSSFPGGQEGEIAWDSDDDVLYAHNGTQWFGLAPASGIITDHGGLTGLNDDDHLQYGLLAGDRTRNVASGVYDFRTGDILVPTETSGQTTLADGQSVVEGSIAVINGQLAAYDGTRSKWLSINRSTYAAAKKGTSNDVYLRTVDGLAHSDSGIYIGADATIVGLEVQASDLDTFTVEVRRNDTVTVVASLVISAADSGSDLTLNANVDAGDELQIYINGASKSPHVILHLAQRF